MPTVSSRRSLWLGSGVAALAAASLGLGWWLGHLHSGRPDPQNGKRPGLDRDVAQLIGRMDKGEASPAEQQRLLELLVAVDRRAEAIPRLERLADQAPQRWQLRLLLAELRRDQNDRPGAERELRQLLSARPDQIEALQLMALIQLETGRGAEAQAQLEAALKRASEPTLKPEALPIGLLLAQVHQRSGQVAKADAALLELAGRFDADPRPLLARALLQKEAGNLAAAQQTLAEARSRQSNGAVQDQIERVATAWGMETLKGTGSVQSPAAPAGAGVENP
jgi:tetratricopeptide (TPR) repeat protein